MASFEWCGLWQQITRVREAKTIAECLELAPIDISGGYDAHAEGTRPPHLNENPMHFLVVDPRFGTPIYVFLESDPQTDASLLGLTVQEVTLEAAMDSRNRRTSIGRDPNHLRRFREFASDGAVARAGFILMEPRFVGVNWESYSRQFRPEGEKPPKRMGRSPATARTE